MFAFNAEVESKGNYTGFIYTAHERARVMSETCQFTNVTNLDTLL